MGKVQAVRLEAARTNSILRSEDFSDAEWTKNNSPVITTDDAVAPDGTQTADKIDDQDGTDSSVVFQAEPVSDDSLARCNSVFVKKRSSGPVMALDIRYLGGSTQLVERVVFDPINGDTNSTPNVERVVVEDYNSDWWRIAVVASNNGTGNTSMRHHVFPAARPSGDVSSTTIDGTVTGHQHVWGAQMEGVSGGASFPSSYIKTTSSTVSRAADDVKDDYVSDPQEASIYVKMIENGTVVAGQNGTLVEIGKATSEANHRIYNPVPEGEVMVEHRDSNGNRSRASLDPTGLSIGDTLEILLKIHSDGSPEVVTSVDGGSTESSGQGPSQTFADSFSTPKIAISRRNTDANVAFATFIAGPIIAPGVRTMSEMRELADT